MGRKELDKAQRYREGIRHPVRRQIIRMVVKEQEALSPSKTAARLDVHLSVVSYHYRELVKAGVLRLAFTRPRRGAAEHFYRPVEAAIKHPIIQLMLTEKG